MVEFVGEYQSWSVKMPIFGGCPPDLRPAAVDGLNKELVSLFSLHTSAFLTINKTKTIDDNKQTTTTKYKEKQKQ